MQKHKIAIVGAGAGGRAILAALTTLNTVQVVGIADLRTDAPGMVLARSLGIPTMTNIDFLAGRADINVIIEATGRADVLARLEAMKHPETQLVGAEAAQVMMELVSVREQTNVALTTRASDIEGLARQATQVSERITNAMETLQKTSAELAASGQQLSAAATQTEQSLGEVEEVLGFLRQVANKTRMIGLNAAIEAARVGEQGQGFAVVASEVRKLAQTSNESAENISVSLQQTLDSVKAILDGVVSSTEVAEAQAVATAEVHGALQQLAELIKQLGDVAEQFR